MSGEKTLQIALQNWYRRQIMEPLVRSLDSRTVEHIREGMREQLDSDLGDIRRRQAGLEGAMKQLSQRNSVFERETARRLGEHVDQLEQRLLASGDELRTELFDALAGTERVIRSELEEQRREHKDDVRRLQAGVDEVRGDRQRAGEAARSWLDDGQVMRDLIENSLPHERYAPGALAELSRKLDDARHHLDQGRPEAAVVTAQTTFDSLAGLRVDVELKQREWVALRAAARQALVIVDERVRLNTTSAIVDQHGEAIAKAQFDVDHWSDGALSELRRDVAKAIGAVRDDELMTVDELKSMVTEHVPAFDMRLGEVVDVARRRVMAAQVRTNIAGMVAEALQDGFAYQAEQWVLAGGDDREAIFVRMGHLSGNEIVVEVAPAGADRTDAQLRLRSFDHDTGSAAQRGARGAAIQAHLRSYELPVGDLQDNGEPDRRDLPAELRGDETPGWSPA